MTKDGRVKWFPVLEGVYEVKVDLLSVVLNAKSKEIALVGPLGIALESFSFKSLKKAAAKGESRYCEVCSDLLEMAINPVTPERETLSDNTSKRTVKKVLSQHKVAVNKNDSGIRDDIPIDVGTAVRELADRINETSEIPA